jgi:hypothetical protein
LGKQRRERGDAPESHLFVLISSMSLARGKSGTHPTSTGWYNNLMEIRLWKKE